MDRNVHMIQMEVADAKIMSKVKAVSVANKDTGPLVWIQSVDVNVSEKCLQLFVCRLEQ